MHGYLIQLKIKPAKHRGDLIDRQLLVLFQSSLLDRTTVGTDETRTDETIDNRVQPFGRRYPVGAEVLAGDRVHFRVWASKRQSVALVLEPDARLVPLEAEGNGYFSSLVEGLP